MSPRRRLEGPAAVRQALDDGWPLRVLLVPRGPLNRKLTTLRNDAERVGAEIWRASPGDLRRMSANSRQPAEVLGMCGSSPSGDIHEVLGRGGLCWLMHRAAYPSNVGFTIRTAEVSGAEAVFVDAPDWNHANRSRASHVSMGADRLLPVLFEETRQVLGIARGLGHQILALEDVGERAPFDLDLRGPTVVLVGNERDGLPSDLLARCDDVMRIPMPGFVPSYNLQATVAAVACERLRQLACTCHEDAR